MKKLKVMTVVGTRPEIIRLSRVLARLDESCEHILVHTGQNYDYELSQIFFEDLGIRKPDYFLDAAASSASAAETIGKIIIAMDPLLTKVRPDAMLILGDTNSCLSVIPAKRQKIPVFHMEAGNRCFDQRVPEEINRRIVDHTADVNLTYSSIAREYLLREGLPPDLVIKTGSPMAEVLGYYHDSIAASPILSVMQLAKRKYFVVSAHREENIDSPASFTKLVGVLNALAQEYQLPVIVSCHPRTKKKLDESEVTFNHYVKLMKPMGFYDYIKLQLDAKVVLSDSGTITEESSILGFPALNLREAHERPEGMEEAAVMMVGLELDRIKQGLSIIESQTHSMRMTNLVSDYAAMNVSEKVVRLVHSYTDYVNRVVWKKY